MSVAFFIARRYFFSRKQKNFINIIAFISMLGVAVGTAALVITMSVFNGLEGLMRQIYNTFDAEIKIVPAQGKSFEYTLALQKQLAGIQGVEIITDAIEDNVLLRYNESQVVGKIKGVNPNFLRQQRIDTAIIAGSFSLKKGDFYGAIVGIGIQNKLDINIKDDFTPLQIWYPKAEKNLIMNPNSAFSKQSALVSGVFSVEREYDSRYVFTDIALVQNLLGYTDKRSYLEIKTNGKRSIETIQKEIKKVLGKDFLVLNSDEQHADLMRILRIEKIFVFLTLSFIIFIASINIFFSLSMLAIEKQHDVAILKAMGAENKLIKQIFFAEGGLVAIVGAAIGLLAGLVICLLQQQFGIVPMGMQTGIVLAYPVELQLTDFVLTALVIAIITLLVVYRPALRAAQVVIKEKI
jgi:lipoprotein-releasing system permease protein